MYRRAQARMVRVHARRRASRDGVRADRRVVGVHARVCAGERSGRESVRAGRRAWWALRACLVRLDDESRAGVTHRVVVLVVLIRLPAVPVIFWPSSSRCRQRSGLAPRPSTLVMVVPAIVISAVAVREKKLTCWVGVDTLDQGNRSSSIIVGAVVNVGDGGRASCFVAVDDTGGRVDFIHGAEGKSVSSICTTGGVLTCHGHCRRHDESTTCRKRKEEQKCCSSFLLR